MHVKVKVKVFVIPPERIVRRRTTITMHLVGYIIITLFLSSDVVKAFSLQRIFTINHRSGSGGHNSISSSIQRRTATTTSSTLTTLGAADQPPDPKSSTTDDATSKKKKKKDNKAMAFLRKRGKVGGHTDFTHALGVDEGNSGKVAGKSAVAMRKSRRAFRSCDRTGVVDSLSEGFPYTSSGTKWTGYTDQVMGGRSTASLTRHRDFHGRPANVLHGRLQDRSRNGFVQMACNLALSTEEDDQRISVDVSSYDGVELEVFNEGDLPEDVFNVHLKTEACLMPYSSYRASFQVPEGEWKTIRLSFDEFIGHGPGASDTSLDLSSLVRAGIVARGSEDREEVNLGVAAVRFY